MISRAATAAVLVALCVALFVAGRAIAEPTAAQKKKYAKAAELLKTRQKKLYEDIHKIDRAGKDYREIQEMRKHPEFILNKYELKMEKNGKKDFHIFMERYRNDTLDTLAILDRVLGKEAYIDPLRRVFSEEKLNVSFEVDWDDIGLDEIVDELATVFKAKIDVKGKMEHGLTINFNGKMTLLAALLQIESLFDVYMEVEGDRLWFVVPDKPNKDK
ncbi:MAG: hypothetical protein ACYTGZ_10950 [Planctomycetota bacterium]|jgi:hypothetical protein